MAELESDPSGLGNSDGTAMPAPPAVAPEPAVASAAAPPVAPAREPAPAPPAPATAPPAAPALDPAVAALCQPVPGPDPCGPDLDFDGDAAYLNYFAQVEGVLPTAFFSQEDGKPFDRATIDLPGQIAAIKPLLARSCDLRLLIMLVRLMALNRDFGGFAVGLAAIAEWLDKYWDAVHPRPQNGKVAARQGVLAALDLPTVVFPMQYMPLIEAGRIGIITYRSWMIANGEVKERAGEIKLSPAAIVEARSDADPAVLATIRKDVAMARTSIERIRNAFMVNGSSAGLEQIATLVGKILAFIDPVAAERAQAPAAGEGDQAAEAGAAGAVGAVPKSAGAAPASLAEVREALAAVADYYSRSEPSSPTLPLVRQAHQLIGKSFFEVMSVLVPTQIDKAAFQIGSDQFFELPVGKLSQLAPAAQAPAPAGGGQAPDATGPNGPAEPRYRVASRSQAIALLEQVQRYFRHNEPSSPVPMLCDRARALAERDFMGVLRDVLPKSALKTTGADK
jgi:type VI secretion system protein ImpA